jgi:hypothetical protein
MLLRIKCPLLWDSFNICRRAYYRHQLQGLQHKTPSRSTALPRLLSEVQLQPERTYKLPSVVAPSFKASSWRQRDTLSSLAVACYLNEWRCRKKLNSPWLNIPARRQKKNRVPVKGLVVGESRGSQLQIVGRGSRWEVERGECGGKTFQTRRTYVFFFYTQSQNNRWYTVNKDVSVQTTSCDYAPSSTTFLGTMLR